MATAATYKERPAVRLEKVAMVAMVADAEDGAFKPEDAASQSSKARASWHTASPEAARRVS